MRGGSGPAASAASAALLQAALGSMPYGFSVWGPDLRLILFNDTYLNLYQFDPDTVRTGMSLKERWKS